MLFKISLVAFAAVAFAADVNTSNTIPAEKAGDSVAGIKILSGNRNGQSRLSNSDAWRHVRVFNDADLAQKIKSGEVSSVSFTQDEVDTLARAEYNNIFKFYSYFPFKNALNLPFLYSRVHSGAADCCAPKANGSSTKRSGRLSGTRRNIIGDLANNTYTSNTIDLAYRWIPDQTIFSLPMLPDNDPFYNPQSLSYVFLKKGDAIAYRRTGFNFGYYPSGTKSFQLSYQTEDSNGGAIADTSVIYVPPDNDNVHVVSFSRHVDAALFLCVDSFGLSLGVTDDVILALLQAKYVVTLADFQGRNMAFSAFVKAGKSTLDNLQAVISQGRTFGTKNNKALLYGYSAASSVVGKAIEMQASYAPGLNGQILAAAVGGYDVDFTKTADHINKGPWAGFIPMSIVGLTREYPAFNAAVMAGLSDTGYRLWLSTLGCANTITNYVGQDMFALFRDGESFFDKEPVRRIVRDQATGKNGFSFPLYILQSATDESAPVAAVDDVVNFYCSQGVHVAYHRDPSNTHLAEEGMFRQHVPGFFQRIINGEEIHTCTDWNSALVDW